MALKNMIGAIAVLVAVSGAADAVEGKVVWLDESCGFFILQLPDPDGFGLYQWKSGPDPKIDDLIEGDELIDGLEIEAANRRAGSNNTLVHWANAASEAMLVRNTPVQCKSKWKRKP